MNLPTEPYVAQLQHWPREGRHILGCYDADTVVVYQAYRPSVARHAVAHGAFGGDDFSYARMSWIKPNFLWMMYRSGWGTKEGQEATLGMRLRRSFFERLLGEAVASSFALSGYATQDAWKVAVVASDVRLQWDPDHDPHGKPLARRALQIGLRGVALEAFGRRELIEVMDLSGFVAEQRDRLASAGVGALRTPMERVYLPTHGAIAHRLKLD